MDATTAAMVNVEATGQLLGPLNCLTAYCKILERRKSASPFVLLSRQIRRYWNSTGGNTKGVRVWRQRSQPCRGVRLQHPAVHLSSRSNFCSHRRLATYHNPITGQTLESINSLAQAAQDTCSNSWTSTRVITSTKHRMTS